jgi:DNA-binding transcriptional LysR family regulator
MRTPLGLMASQRYLDANGTPETLEDLKRHPLLRWRAEQVDPDTLPLLNGSHYPIKPQLVSANASFIREAAAQGGGIAWAMLKPLGPIDAQRALVPVLPDLVGATLEAWLICPLPSTLDPRVRVMLEELLKLLKMVDMG